MKPGDYPGRGLLLAAALGLLIGAAQASSSLPAAPWKETIQRFESIEPGGLLRVSNPYGNVYARFGGYEDRIELLATFQRLGGPELELREDRSADGLVVVVAEKQDGSLVDEPSGPRDRVDLVVFVPAGAHLDVDTRGDLIEIKGLRSDVSASSVQGDIRIRGIHGSVRAKSDHGHLAIVLETGETSEPQELSTRTGDIEVYLWEDADMDVDIATSGEISTDFSLRIEHRRLEEPSKHAAAVVGDGGPQLRLRSKRGRIRLLRLPRSQQSNTRRAP